MLAAHRTKSSVRHILLLVMRHLQRIRENRHLERIGDVHDLARQVVGRTANCRVSFLLCILQSMPDASIFHFPRDGRTLQWRI